MELLFVSIIFPLDFNNEQLTNYIVEALLYTTGKRRQIQSTHCCAAIENSMKRGFILRPGQKEIIERSSPGIEGSERVSYTSSVS